MIDFGEQLHITRLRVFRYAFRRLFQQIHKFKPCCFRAVGFDIPAQHGAVQSHHKNQERNQHPGNDRDTCPHLTVHLSYLEAAEKSGFFQGRSAPAGPLCISHKGKCRSGKLSVYYKKIHGSRDDGRHYDGIQNQVQRIHRLKLRDRKIAVGSCHLERKPEPPEAKHGAGKTTQKADHYRQRDILAKNLPPPYAQGVKRTNYRRLTLQPVNDKNRNHIREQHHHNDACQQSHTFVHTHIPCRCPEPAIILRPDKRNQGIVRFKIKAPDKLL